MPPINEYYTFGYLQTWKILFHRRDWKILFTYLADGVQDFIGLAIWPIFIWQVLAGDFQAVGLVSSLIVLATILLRLLMGNYTDKFDKKRLLKMRGKTHVILTGRNAPKSFIQMADLVTEMKKIKHPYDSGQKAIRGIDF